MLSPAATSSYEVFRYCFSSALLSPGWSWLWIHFMYPDAGGANYVVLPVSLTRSFGQWSVTTGYEYTPSQEALGDTDGTYVWLGADWASETFPLWFSGAIGHEDGGWAPDGKTDWSVGAFHSLGPFELGLTYSDTDEAAAGSAVVAEIRAPF